MTISITETRLKRFLLLSFSSNSSSTDFKLTLSLKTHDTTTPLLFNLGVSVAGVLAGSESSFIFGLNSSQADARSGLLVDEGTELGLAGNDGVSNTHLVAESRKPHNKFERIDIVSNQDELGLLLFNELGNVIETVLSDEDVLLSFDRLAFSFSLGLFNTLSLLFSSSFRSILGEEAEDVSSYRIRGFLDKDKMEFHRIS